MPELIEVELYARSAHKVIGRRVAALDTPDTWYLKGVPSPGVLRDALVGSTVAGIRRRGKLLLIDLAAGSTLGLRFGMTGRLLVDGRSAIDRLEYGSSRGDPAWNRFGLHFENGGALVMHDPRRLGGVQLDPDEAALGIDATLVTAAQLSRLLADSAAAVKARLMDQAKLAGLGNLLTDEILWRARIDPGRRADTLVPAEHRRLHRQLVVTLAELAARGGSHLGDLQIGRQRGGLCPRCPGVLSRRRIGGRTTYSCPLEQT